MERSANDIDSALPEKEISRDVSEERAFYLQTLLDTSRELARLSHPRMILDSFLLMTMGSLGIVQGMAALINTETGQADSAGRGIPGTVVEELRRNLPRIREKHFTAAKIPNFSLPWIKLIPGDILARDELCPDQVRILVLWEIPGGYSGFLGLGARITGRPFNEDELDVLLDLTDILTNSLSRALSFQDVQQRNTELLSNNSTLKARLDQVKGAREELDKRVFHLKTLSDLNDELRSTIEIEELLRSYLHTAMGSLGIGRGFVLAYDRIAKEETTVYCGTEPEKQLGPEACEKLLYKAFDAMEHKTVAPMSIGRLNSPGLLKDFGIELNAACGFFFVIEQEFMGIAVFGTPLSGRPLTADDLELLSTQTAGLTAYLENSRAFSKINSLNEDLTSKNEQLRRTIQELTEAKTRITILERTRAHLRAILQREAERTARVNPVDCGLILLFALLMGVLFNFASPHGIPILPISVIDSDFPSVSATEARKLIEEKNAVLVDARPKLLYTQKHIAGAISVPLTLFDLIYMMKLGMLDPQRPLIVYGRHISRLYDVEVAQRLKKRDHDNVKVLPGGVRAWEDAGYQVQ